MDEKLAQQSAILLWLTKVIHREAEISFCRTAASGACFVWVKA
jgi:hypothetical protein